jgi:hypothetical protein
VGSVVLSVMTAFQSTSVGTTGCNDGTTTRMP